MNFFENMETTQEFTPKQMEAQEAMAETTERTGAAAEAVENTPEYWQKLAQQELDMYGESDAYREYAAKAEETGDSKSVGSSETEPVLGSSWEGFSYGHSESYWKEKVAEAKMKDNTADYNWAMRNLKDAVANREKFK